MELIPAWYLYLHKPSAWPSYIDAQGVVSACSAGHVGMQREVACNKAEAVQGMQRGATSTLPVLNQALDHSTSRRRRKSSRRMWRWYALHFKHGMTRWCQPMLLWPRAVPSSLLMHVPFS